MSNRTKKFLTVGFFLAALGTIPSLAGAVAFKVCNDSHVTVLARVADRGAWRNWVECGPGYWGDIATQVERTGHWVEFAIQDDYGNWQTIYSKVHGSRLFTRVAQVVDAGDGFAVAWWDERGNGCRDRPPNPVYGGSSCLRPSNFNGMLRNLAVRAGMMIALGS